MNDDQLIRLILGLEMAVLLPSMAFYRIKAQATGESLNRWQEGIFILVTLRLLGLACFGGLLVFLINPAWLSWSTSALPMWLRWIGVSLFAIAGVVIVWSFHNLGKNLTDTVVTRRVHTLVLVGPYRWVRHPFYVGMALMVCGIWLATANWFFLATGVAFLGVLVMRTRKEEEKLIERFGDEYRRYMQHTPRFLPTLGRMPLK